jgi:hypothetical protein
VPSVRQVESRIFDREGFRVTVRHLDGRNVRGDRGNLPQYPFERAMKNRASVARWIAVRFLRTYPGFEVDVLKSSGERAHGRMLLSTVRDGYLED